jgi:acyl-CoA hydrolase
MSVIEEYKRKLISADEAASLIRDNESLYISGNAAAPLELLRALARRPDKPKNVKLIHTLLLKDEGTAAAGMEMFYRHVALFIGPADREAINSGRGECLSIHLHDIPKAIKLGHIPIDTVFAQVSPMDEHGFFSLGVEICATKTAIRHAKRVVVQVNENMPWIYGDTFVHLSEVDYIVEHTEELPEYKTPPVSAVERQIAKYVSELIEDGSTLQTGIGGIPFAILQLLEGKKDIGIHTELFSDGVMEGIKKGIITGKCKTLNYGRVVATFVLGTKKLYNFVNNNPIIEGHPVEYTNDQYIISRQNKMVAINGALEVDLTGQVCADSLGTKFYSGFGGQLDFIRGASEAPNGKPIIVLPSTTSDEKISRIVPVLKPGAGVVTTRADVHYVVTEYGVAYLFGKTIQERAKALISVAHPKFREELEKAAYERKLIPHAYYISKS